jgi:tRNA-2-methylthio-N6-dimethylallyladenosine synthase
VVVAEITAAAPHHLVSDLPVDGVRRTRAGDAWLSRQSSAADGVPSGGGSAPVLLGLPTIRT